MAIDQLLRRLVRHRAGGLCEYCRFPEANSSLSHQIDHIVARQHGGDDLEGNLALACQPCNARKVPNIAGIDPDRGIVVALFDPRRDKWSDHFSTQDALILGSTSTGRATVALLGMNTEVQVEKRRQLSDRGMDT